MAHRITVAEESRQDVDTRNLTPAQLAADTAMTGTYVAHLGPATADDTARIQAALTAARVAGGGTVLGMAGQTYKTSSTLVTGTGVDFDLSRSGWTLLAGSNCQMITNYSSANVVATAADGAISSGSNVVTTALGATAVVGQSVQVGTFRSGAAGNGYGPLMGLVSAKTSTTITIVDLDGSTLNATTTVSSATVILRNRDSNFKIRVGTMDRGANGPSGTSSTPGSPLFGSDVQGHSVFIKGADNFDVEIGKALSTAGISFVWPTDVRHFRVSIHDSNVVRTALQIVGPAFDGIVPVVRGFSTDDLFCICGNVYPDQTNTAGNIRDIVIGSVFANGTDDSALKIIACNGFYIDNVLVTGGVFGTAGKPIMIGEDSYYPETLGGSYGTIDFGYVGASAPSGIVAQLPAMTAKTVRIKARVTTANAIIMVGATAADIDLLDLTLDCAGTLQTPVLISTNYNIRTLRVTGTYRNASGSPMVSISTGAVIQNVILDKVTADNLNTAACLVSVNGTVESLTLRDCRVKWPDTSGQSFAVKTGNTGTPIIRHIKILGGSYENGNSIVRLFSVAASYSTQISDVSTLNVGRLFTGSIATALELGVIYMRGNINAPIYEDTAALDVYGGPIVVAGGTSRVAEIGASGTIRSRSTGIRVDVAHLTVAADQLAYNLNSASGPTGPVWCDGTNWLPLSSYKRTGTATLAAGTVTVSDAAITTASRIRVYVKTPGGTVGAPFVSAKTASTGFVITSTSNADTSVIQYEVLSDV